LCDIVPKKLETAEEKLNFINSFDNFLFDCDGVIWHASTVLEGVREVLYTLKKMGKRIFYVTNNSSKSRATYLKKFQKLDLPATLDDIFSSAVAAAYYVKHFVNIKDDEKIYVVGGEGICRELEEQGVHWCGCDEDNKPISEEEFTEIQPDPKVKAVMFGFDVNINYRKFARAFTYLNSNPDCLFLATNTDMTYPTKHLEFPGTGSMIHTLIAGTKRTPTVLGKPTTNMMDCIIQKFSLDRSRTCMVGDRLITDIAFGMNSGLSTLLVLTGVTTVEAMNESKDIKPNYYISSLGDLHA